MCADGTGRRDTHIPHRASDTTSTALNNVDILDWSTMTVTAAPIGLSVGRYRMCAAYANGWLLFMGGYECVQSPCCVRWNFLCLCQLCVSMCDQSDTPSHSSAAPSAVVDMYDLATGTWTKTTLAQPVVGCACSSFGPNGILISGGSCVSHAYFA